MCRRSDSQQMSLEINVENTQVGERSMVSLQIHVSWLQSTEANPVASNQPDFAAGG